VAQSVDDGDLAIELSLGEQFEFGPPFCAPRAAATLSA
jgi:hypothetical protein